MANDMMEYMAILEPLPGHSDKEIVTSLQKLGASKVEVLSPGFISAKASGKILKLFNKIASVHLKRDSQLRLYH